MTTSVDLRALADQFRTFADGGSIYVGDGMRPPLKTADLSESLNTAAERIEKLEALVREALETAGNRWEEWGSRAMMVKDVLDRAKEVIGE